MRIIHRVSIASTPRIQEELARIGVRIAPEGLATFEIDEGDVRWSAVENWIGKRAPVDLVETKFSTKDVANASWLALVPAWHHGYPQPAENEFGYRSITYDLSEWCDRCGIGMKQKAPFQMRGEPKWGKYSILQLNWVFDEYFVTPDLWSRVFEPRGVECRPVLAPSGTELKNVVQLVASEQVKLLVAPGNVTTCPQCQRSKYLPLDRGLFPSLAGSPASSFVRTAEYFGSGASAYNALIVPQVIATELIAERVRGVTFHPLA
jgi:rRNA maturation protein Nop10